VFITKLTIVPASGKREAVLEILKFVEIALRGRTECGDCGVFEQKSHEEAIVYSDQWSSMEALSLHIRSDLFLRMLFAMELAARQPEIVFYEISSEKGLGWIQDLRGTDESSCPEEIRT
jgi:quinol monooxygenase YgiN